MRKVVKTVLWSLLLLLVLLFAGLYWLLFTESGSRKVEQLAMHYMPQLSIENPAGRILVDYRIERLGWKEDAATVEATRLHLQSDFSAFFRREIRGVRLEMEKLSLDLKTPEQPEESAPESAEAPAGFSLPVDLELDQLSVGRLELGINGQRYVLDEIRLAGMFSGSDISDTKVMLRSEFEGRPVALKLTGQVGLAWPPAFDLEAGIDATDPLLGAMGVTLDLSGNLHDYAISAQVSSDSAQLGQNNLSLAATGDLEGVVVQSAKLTGDNGEMDLAGQLQWQDVMAWQADLAFREISSSRAYPEYPATVSGDLSTSGQLVEGQPRVEIALHEIQGVVNEYPLSAEGAASLDGKTLNISELLVSAGDNRLQANGQVAEVFDLVFELKADRLDQLMPGADGNLVASGTLEGNLEKPLLTAEIDGEKLAFGDYALEHIKLDFSTEGELVSGEGVIKRLDLAGQLIQEAGFSASGSLQKHTLGLRVVHDIASVETALSGGWSEERWQGSMDQLDIREEHTGQWSLEAPVDLTASASQVRTGELCLKNGEANACTNAEWDIDTGIRSAGKGTNLQLAMLDSLLPESVRLSGTIGFDYDLEQTGELPSAKAKVAWSAGNMTLSGETGEARTFNYDAGQLDALLENDKLNFSGGVTLPGYAEVDARGDLLLSPEDGKHTVDAALKASAPDLTWLDEFIPEATLLRGKLTADGQLSGELAAPVIRVDARLQDGQLKIDRTGETLDDITLSVKSVADNRFDIDGSLKAGEGTLTTKGTMVFEGVSWSTRLEIKGSQLQLLDSHEIKVQVAPDILIEANQEKVIMSGTLLIPEAAIRLSTLPESAVTETDDVIILGKGGTRPPPPGEGLGFEPRLKVVLGDKVTFSGYGLDARLTGEFRTVQVKQSLVTDGFLTINDGTYNLFGQTLMIERGRLVFNGPLDNPGIDFRIVRDVDEVTVGMNVSGTLVRPTSSVFSNPPMSDTEAFSYLLLGRSLEGASSGDGAMLMSMAKTLGVEGGSGFLSNLGAGLGIDASISTSEGFQKSELQLGKRIGENLYLKYMIGLVEDFQTVAIEYRINKNLRVEAETGTETGADLI
ncbi:MAG: translocation/assembly module TamB domain-containing protein, partial [Chromatiales bacterium]